MDRLPIEPCTRYTHTHTRQQAFSRDAESVCVLDERSRHTRGREESVREERKEEERASAQLLSPSSSTTPDGRNTRCVTRLQALDHVLERPALACAGGPREEHVVSSLHRRQHLPTAPTPQRVSLVKRRGLSLDASPRARLSALGQRETHVRGCSGQRTKPKALGHSAQFVGLVLIGGEDQ